MRRVTTKSFLVLLVCIETLLGFSFASVLSADDKSWDVLKFPICQYCGMHREAHVRSRMLIVYVDGSAFGACSLYCAALNLVIQIDRVLDAVWVADYESMELVRAEAATWVIGGAKTGVMTSRAKWAFKSRESAKKFVEDSGGVLASFDEAMRATFEDMYRDTKMIRTKKNIGKMAPY